MEIKEDEGLIYIERKRKCFFEEVESKCIWNAKKSKIAAAILKGMDYSILKKDKILYLGASYGYTVTRLANLLPESKIFAVEVAREPFVKLMGIARELNNIIPLLEDANKPEEYTFIGKVDLIIQDIAQKNQTEILIKNIKRFLKKRGTAIYALKTKAIDSVKSKEEVLKEEINVLKSENMKVKEIIDIHDYEKYHYVLIIEKAH